MNMRIHQGELRQYEAGKFYAFAETEKRIG